MDLTLASSYNPSYVTANGDTTAGAEAALAHAMADGKGYLNIHTSTDPSMVSLVLEAVRLTVFRRRHLHLACEHAREIKLVPVADRPGDLLDAQRRAGQ